MGSNVMCLCGVCVHLCQPVVEPLVHAAWRVMAAAFVLISPMLFLCLFCVQGLRCAERAAGGIDGHRHSSYTQTHNCALCRLLPRPRCLFILLPCLVRAVCGRMHCQLCNYRALKSMLTLCASYTPPANSTGERFKRDRPACQRTTSLSRKAAR